MSQSSNALITPYLDIGPYLKDDSYFDNVQKDATEDLYDKGKPSVKS